MSIALTQSVKSSHFKSDLSLTKALDICHVAEASKVQLKTMSGEAKKGNNVHGKGKQKSRSKPSIFHNIAVTISSSKRVKHKAGPKQKIPNIVVKRTPV